MNNTDLEDNVEDNLDLPTVLVTDETGRGLSCYVEHSLQLKEGSYAVLLPVDTPVCFFTWLNEEDEEPVLIEDEVEIGTIYPLAKAVLEEQNLTLHWTAFTLTVSGDVPEVEEDDDDYGYEPEDANGTSHEAFQLLAEFFHKDQEYAVCAPLDPFLILARMEQGQPQILEPEELDRIQPILEEYLAGQLDIDKLEDDFAEEE